MPQISFAKERVRYVVLVNSSKPQGDDVFPRQKDISVYGPFETREEAERWKEEKFPLQRRLDHDWFVSVNEMDEP